MTRTAIMNIRLPRVAAAVLVGAALASAGAVMQCVLRNPSPPPPPWAYPRVRLSAQR